MGAHKAAREGRSFAAELRKAVTPRAVLLVMGVLALQLGFIASYLGAFHQPTPHKVPLAVVAPQQSQQQVVDQLTDLSGEPVDVTLRTTDRLEAEQHLMDRDIDGVFVFDPSGQTDTLLVANGAGAALGQALEKTFGEFQQSQDRDLRTEDLAPPAPGDARALSAFYVVVGWCVGGYLCAAIIAMSYGARPANVNRALIRLAVLALYAVVSGFGGAAVAGPLLDALPGSFLGLAGLGALTVFSVGTVTLALQALAGVTGIGLAILLVVVLGNPSAGGAYPRPLLPTFWREIGPAIPTGAGTWSARSLAYFEGAAMTGPLLVLAGWAAVGTVCTLLFTLMRRRQVAEDEKKPFWAR